MKVLITAGGTQEPIDSVRSITNLGTGRLGAMIADAFAARTEVEEVLYLCNRQSVLPETKKARIIYITGTLELEEAIRSLAREVPDAIVHSMAVSDYRVRRVTTVTAMAEAAAASEGQAVEEIAQAIAQAAPVGERGKISSSLSDLVILLEKTPKIISLLRDLVPQAVIVGFKLLDGVSEEELLHVAHTLLQNNDCDYVLANDMKTVATNTHCGYLMDHEKQVSYYEGKARIAKGIAETVCRKVAKG